jgi:hypothetical protein
MQDFQTYHAPKLLPTERFLGQETGAVSEWIRFWALTALPWLSARRGLSGCQSNEPHPVLLEMLVCFRAFGTQCTTFSRRLVVISHPLFPAGQGSSQYLSHIGYNPGHLDSIPTARHIL